MPKETLVKIIPKPKPEIPSSLKFLFWFSLVLLIALGGVFFYFQKQISALNEKKNTLENQMTTVGTPTQKALEKEIFNTAEKIKDFSKISKEHKIVSKFFEFLESYCHPKVQFTSLNLDTKNYIANLTGNTENFQTLGEQILIFKGNENVKGLKISNVSLGEDGKVKFNLTFNFSPTLIEK
jgi:hypothetical protein